MRQCLKTATRRFRVRSAELVALPRQGLAVTLSFVLVLAPLVSVTFAIPVVAKSADRDEGRRSRVPKGDCDLRSVRGDIQHVIYIQFDNVHLKRDNPNVPSDLEQMPNLLNFMEKDGALLSNHHTPLISHTADDIITSLTGVYGDRHGIPVANSFGFFTPPGSSSFDGFSSAFTYWTDPVNSTTDTTPIMLAANGKNAPAPWVPFTRAGCNVGAVSIANMELENVGSDVNNVFGPTSPETAEAKANFSQAVADFEGIAVHCAASNPLCSSANGGEPDVLSQEPGNYTEFNALFGHKFVAPQISPGGPLKDLDSNLITDVHGNNGFPGFSGISAAQTLSYVASMQEHGVPVTFAYIADAHDNASKVNLNTPKVCSTDPETGGLGPGDVCYEAQLAAYDEAFGKFFARLASDGINQFNTLFVITADEDDHFAGGPATPSTCDGVTIPCTYSKLGEVQVDITHLLNQVDPTLASTPFDIHFDMAPTFYVKGNPAPGEATARAYELATSKLTATNPITGQTDQLSRYLADPVEMKLLHMLTADPQRTPTFVMFGNPDYFFQTSQTSGEDVIESPAFAWNHGGVAPEIDTTWLGLVGPGVRVQGVDGGVWSDHADIRPTMLVLLGLRDDYAHEGRALVEELYNWAIPDGVKGSGDEFTELARTFKQINAPVGDLGLTSLRVSTTALTGDTSTYNQLENDLAAITSMRDALANQMSGMLEDAEFHGQRISERDERILDSAADRLLDYVHRLAQ